MADGMDKAHALRTELDRACTRCRTTPQSWAGGARQCAFTTGTFSPDNWNCATMNLLREQVELAGLRVYGEDESLGVVREADGFVVLSWYKNRGRTSVAQVVTSDGVNPLTLEYAERVLTELGV